MLKISRILRDHHDAGSLNSLLAPWAFVDDGTFLTKAGHLGVVYRLAGVDYECLDQPQRRDVVHGSKRLSGSSTSPAGSINTSPRSNRSDCLSPMPPPRR